MGTTRINVSAILGLDGQISQARNNVTSVKTSFRSVYNQVEGRILERNNLYNRFQTAYSHLAAVETRIKRIKNVAETGARSYHDTDMKLLEQGSQINVGLSSRKRAGSSALSAVRNAFEKYNKNK